MFEARDWWAVKADGRQVPVPDDVAAAMAAPGLLQLVVALQPPPPPPPAPPVDVAALLAEAEARGFAAGAAEARAAAEAALAPHRAALASAVDAFAAAMVVDADALAPVLAGLVRGLCETVLAAELARPDALLPLARAALALLAPDEPAVLAGHPDVLAGLAPLLPPDIRLAADAALAADRLEVRGAQLVIVADAGARLAEALAALDGAA